jgi:hypothetical protein
MSRDDIDRVLERIRQGTEARMRGLGLVRRYPSHGVDGTRISYPVGTLVFDPVTGETGEVIGGATENVVVPTTQR